MTAFGVLGTMLVSLMSFIQSIRNGHKLRAVQQVAEGTAERHVETLAKINNIETATNGMKAELETKAYEAGKRSSEDSLTAATRAADTAATAAKVVADAAKTAADLVAATAMAVKKE